MSDGATSPGGYAYPAMEPAAIVPLPTEVDPVSACAPITGEPGLVRALGAVLHRVPHVVVVVAEPFVDAVAEVLAGATDAEVIGTGAADGGREALRVGLEHLGVRGYSTILLHDWRHPLAPAEVTDRVLARLATGARIVVPVTPVTDSVKAVDAVGAVIATVDRAELRNVQYPRGFAIDTLAALSAHDADPVVAALASGVPVETVDGHADAGRFDLPADAALLEAIIATRR